MTETPQLATVELPENPVLLRRIARMLEQQREWRSLASVLDAMLRLDPKDWRTWLKQHDALISAGREDEARDCLKSALSRALQNGRDTAVFRRLLESGVHESAIVEMQAALLAKNPADWRAAVRYAIALEASGDHQAAQKVIAETVSSGLLTSMARKKFLEQLHDRDRHDLVAIALQAFAQADAKGLLSYLGSPEGAARGEDLLNAVRRVKAPGWDPLQFELAEIERLENRGRTDEADRAYSAIEGVLSVEMSPQQATPTASTLMFRNHRLLDCLVSAIAWFIEQNGRISVHVGACSTGEEAYSLALLLTDAGLIEHCALSGSDVDAALVKRARTGVIETRSAAAIPQAMLDSYFQRQRDGRVRLDAAILRKIDFSVVDLSQQAPDGEQHDVLVANNMLVHFPVENANRMLRRMVDRVQPAGLLSIGGSRQDGLQRTIEASGLVAVTTHADVIFEGWQLQRRAWYVNPRPYWALPPARLTAIEPWHHAALFVRSAATARALEARLASLELT